MHSVNLPPDQSRILIVDDDPSVLNAVSFSLRRFGYRVFEASTHEDTRRALKESRPDAVLLDIHLASGLTFDLAAEIRHEPEYDGTAVVAVSGYDNEPTRSEALRHCDGFVGKPFAVQYLVQELRAAIDRQRAKRVKGENAETLRR